MSKPERIAVLSPEQLTFAQDFFSAALQYLHKPFVNHAATVRCGSRPRTYPGCMEIGLGPEGYDCSGLVIRALADVTGISETDWADGIRHVGQMSRKATRVTLSSVGPRHDYPIGLPFVYDHVQPDLRIPSAHIGIYAGNGQLLHARSRGTNRVALDVLRTRATSKRFAFAIDPSSLL